MDTRLLHFKPEPLEYIDKPQLKACADHCMDNDPFWKLVAVQWKPLQLLTYIKPWSQSTKKASEYSALKLISRPCKTKREDKITHSCSVEGENRKDEELENFKTTENKTENALDQIIPHICVAKQPPCRIWRCADNIE